MTTENTTPWTLVGQKAPDFKGMAVINGDIKEISLADYKGKWKVLFFYPLDFTFVCPTELVAFSDKIEMYQKLGCEVIGCSIDSEFSHLKWTQTPVNEGGFGELKYPLLADVTKKIATDYGCLMDGAVAFRATYIIDDQDVVQHMSINNLSVGRNVEEFARLVAGYQYTAKHGEVCPAGWSEGADTMKPDPTGSKEYFSKLK